jgi:hypothetical protein
MDLGLDPASKQTRKMIGRVDKRLVFKPPRGTVGELLRHAPTVAAADHGQH